jgi:hypothetical protein
MPKLFMAYVYYIQINKRRRRKKKEEEKSAQIVAWNGANSSNTAQSVSGQNL